MHKYLNSDRLFCRDVIFYSHAACRKRLASGALRLPCSIVAGPTCGTRNDLSRKRLPQLKDI